MNYNAFQIKHCLLLLSIFLIACTNELPKYESIAKDAAFRESVLASNEGQYVELTNGFTYYEQANPDSIKGPIVLVHGFSVPSYIWEESFHSLQKEGYRVVMLDLYGRGNSDNPDLSQTDELRAQQVIDLMTEIDIDKAVLVGLSNGGRIISKIADLDATKVQALFYVSSSSFEDPQKQNNTYVSQREIRDFIKTYPTRAVGQLNDFYAPEKFPNWAEKYEKLLLHKGFAKALLSTAKNLVTLDNVHAKIAALGIPVYTFWGVHDKVVVYSNFKEKLNNLFPNRKEFFIEKAAHLPQMENKEEFERFFFDSLEEVLDF